MRMKGRAHLCDLAWDAEMREEYLGAVVVVLSWSFELQLADLARLPFDIISDPQEDRLIQAPPWICVEVAHFDNISRLRDSLIGWNRDVADGEHSVPSYELQADTALAVAAGCG